MSQFKAQAMSRSLKESIKLTVAGASFEEGTDANAFPLVRIKKGSESLFVKIEMVPDASAHVDALGLPQRLYSPHQAIILREDAAGAAPSEFGLREKVTAECAKLGCKVKLFEKEGIAAATDLSAYDLSGATLVVELSADPTKSNPMTNSQ